MTALSVLYVSALNRSEVELPLRLITVLVPVFPVILFVWSILQQRMLPLVIERTFVYGGVLAIIVLVHRLLLAPLTSVASERVNLDFVLVEWIGIFSLVMIVRPLRQRARGALRFLLSYDPFQLRDITRQLSVELSQQTEVTVPDLASWFSRAMQDRLAVESVVVFLNEPFLLCVPTPNAGTTDERDRNLEVSVQPLLARLKI